ncbi:MAG: hypothetical protein HZC22_13520 [Rhodocyclales bacterium]|nr:hypothetical protein [Rhodocyclales bacterium]
MAVRAFSSFHTEGQRSAATQASVVAILAWKLAVDAIKRMRRADYDIDVGRPYFDFICEFLIFMAMAADRVAYLHLEPEKRADFTTALAKRLAEIVEENNYVLMGSVEPGACQRHFLDLFNRRSGEYAEFDYGPDGPDFGFKRLFAACLREGLPEKDRLWAVDQVMEIEVPEALKALDKSLAGLFGLGGGRKPRRERAGVTGE